jgi:hypothetical protein
VLTIVTTLFTSSPVQADTHVHDVLNYGSSLAGADTVTWMENTPGLYSDYSIDPYSFITKELWVDLASDGSTWIESGGMDGSLVSVGGCKSDGCEPYDGGVQYWHGPFWAYAISNYGAQSGEYDEHTISTDLSNNEGSINFEIGRSNTYPGSWGIASGPANDSSLTVQGYVSMPYSGLSSVEVGMESERSGTGVNTFQTTPSEYGGDVTDIQIHEYGVWAYAGCPSNIVDTATAYYWSSSCQYAGNYSPGSTPIILQYYSQ